MSATPSPAPAPESIDARIARLKAELADAELQKLDDDMGEAAGAFLELSAEGSDVDEIRAALEICIDAWRRFEAWRTARGVRLTETIRHHCSRCGAAGHRAPACPDNYGPARRSAFGTVKADGASGFSARWHDGETRRRKRGFATRGEAEAFLARIRPADPRDQASAPELQEPQERQGAAGAAGAAGPPPPAADDLPLDLAAMGDDPEVPPGPAEADEPILPAPAPAPPPPGRIRARGTGSVLRNGTGFRWTLARNGVILRGRTWPTREAAEAELNRAVAEPDFVPAPKSTRAILAAPEPGDDLQRDHAVSVRERSPVSGCFTPSTPTPPPGPATATPAPTTRFSIRVELNDNDRGGAARRRTNDRRRIEAASAAASPPAVDAGDDEVADEEDGEGWSPADADGRQTCLPCGGEGVDNRPGEGAGRCCLHCDGEGYRWPDGDTAPPVTPAAAPEPTSPAAPTPAARPPESLPPATESHPGYLHPGRGWGPVDASGVSVHGLCNGTGKIRVKGVARGCYPCESTGRRQCVPRAAAADGRTR